MVDSRYWRRKWWLWLWWLRIYCDGGFKQHWLHGECPFNVDFTISFICFLFVLKFSPCQPWNFCNYCTSLLLTISSQYLSYDIHDGDEKDDDGVTHLNGGIPPEKVQWEGASGHKHWLCNPPMYHLFILRGLLKAHRKWKHIENWIGNISPQRLFIFFFGKVPSTP